MEISIPAPGRRSRRLHPSRPIALVAALAIVVFLFVTAAATGADWRTSLPMDGGVIGSGTLDLLGGSASSQVQNYTFAALSGSNLQPGDYRQAPLTIRNAGDIPLRYELASTAFGTLVGALSVTITRVATPAACPATGAPTDAGGSVGGWRALAVAATEVWCFRVTLDGTAPESAQATTGSVVFGFRGEQLRHAV